MSANILAIYGSWVVADMSHTSTTINLCFKMDRYVNQNKKKVFKC